MGPNTINVVKIFLPSLIAFLVGILITPSVVGFLHKYKLWKKTGVKKTIDGQEALISNSLHNDEERKTPRMGGVVVWGSTLLTILIFWLVSRIFPADLTNKFEFFSRNQTWLPIFTLIVGSFVGLIDDYLVCQEKGTYLGGGLSLKLRLLAVFGLSLIGGFWFFFKLDISNIFIPFLGDLNLGFLFIPVFIIFMIGLYSGGIIDGVDGLAGGVFSIMFAAYGLISFFNHQIDLAVFCMVVVGGLLAFLWFNIPPARFFLSETGTMGLTTTLVVVAFLSGAVGVLPIIAFPLVMTTLSSIIQIASKKFRNGKKVFLVAPLHNHFQALGWPPYKVTMRYWVVSFFFAISGIIIQLIG